MLCKKCGKEIEENSKICVFCGEEVKENEKNNDNKGKLNNVKSNLKENSENGKIGKILNVCLIVLGIVSIILGFVVKEMSIGSYELGLSYGGDAYTGIQQAAAQTANNLLETNDILRTGFSYIFIISGILIVLIGFIRVNDEAVKKYN